MQHKELRSRNQYFKNDAISSYIKEYAGAISCGLTRVDVDQLERAYTIIRSTHAHLGRIFVGGNGGSAAIADHLCCDFVKGTHTLDNRALDVHSLVGSLSLFTALANDVGYEHTFSKQLEMARVTYRDCVILISSSGNSPNIVAAMDYAKSVAAGVVGLSGFDGGELKKRADASLHVPFNNYGVIEDCHQALMHIISQFIYLRVLDDRFTP